jgi:hypothetical protein
MLDVFDSEELKVKRDTGSMIDGIRKQYQARHASFEHDKEQTTNYAELRRKAIDTKIEEERKSVAKLQSELKRLQRQYSEHKHATFGAYLLARVSAEAKRELEDHEIKSFPWEKRGKAGCIGLLGSLLCCL